MEWNLIPSMISDHLAFWLHIISTEKSLFWNKGWLQLLLFSLSMDFYFRPMYFGLWKLKMLSYLAAGAYYRYVNFFLFTFLKPSHWFKFYPEGNLMHSKVAYSNKQTTEVNLCQNCKTLGLLHTQQNRAISALQKMASMECLPQWILVELMVL